MTLTDVSETLLMTLYFRNLETQRQDAIISDEKAIDIVKGIEYNFSKFDEDWKSQVAVAVRTEIIDSAVQKFLDKTPKAIIVNLGAGLCTRFFRLDNGQAQWFEVDLEQVKSSWDKLIGEAERHHFIACSVTDFSWMDVISNALQDSDSQMLFIAEGLFMYLPEDEVKKVILEIKNRFPGSEIVIEVIGKYLAKNTQLHRSVAQTDAKFKWGANDCKELETWEPGIQLINQWYFSDRHRDRQGWLLKLLGYIPSVRQQAKVGHLKLSHTYSTSAANS